MTLRQVTLINNGTGGSGGATVTAANSGGGGNAFDGNLLSAGATFAYDTTYVPAQGGVPFKVATVASGQAYTSWAASLTTPNSGAALAQVWFRAYCYVPAALTVNTTIFAAFAAGAGTCGSVKLTTSGVVEALDSTGTVRVTTAAFPLNQWFRVEGFITGSATVGQLNLVLYGAQDSTTASSAPATATGLNTNAAMTGWRFGQATAAANAGPVWLANTGLSNAGYVGPVGYGFSPVRAADGGTTTMVAVGAAGGSSGTPGLVGSTTITGLYPATTTASAAAAAFDSAAGEPMATACQKLYFPNSFPTTIVDGAGDSVSALAGGGCHFWLCYAPAVNGSDMTEFTHALQAWVNAGYGGQVKVVIYQEPQNASWGLTSATFIQAVQAYAAMVHGFGMKIIYDAAGHAQNQWISWYPADATASFTATHATPAVFTSTAPVSDGAPVVLSGASLPGGFTAGTVYYAVNVSGSTFNVATTYDGTGLPSSGGGTSGTIAVRYVDEIAVDYYGNDWVNQGGPAAPDQLNSLYTQANTDGKPFGVGEVGSAIQPSLITNANFATATGTLGGFPLNYMGYLQTLFAGRLSQGLTNSDLMWYSGDKNGPCPNTLSGPTTTVAAGSSGGQISQIATSAWTSATAGSLAPGVLAVTSTANFGTGISAGNLYVQCGNGTVAVINYAGISGNTFTGCTYTSGSASGTVSTGAFVSCYAFLNGVTTDFRVPYVQSLYAALTAPSGPSVLAAGGDSQGFFTTATGGATWDVANAGVDGASWRDCATLAWSVAESGTLYACVGNQGSGGGFLVSTNGGASWAMRGTQVQYAGNTTAGLSPADQSRSTGGVLAQDAAGSGLMYTCGYNSGVWRTTASQGYGSTWTQLALGGGTHHGRCIAVNPSNSAQVFAGMYGEGVYESTNASSSGTFTLMTGGPEFPEQMVWCASGNVYCAAGYGGGGQPGYAPGGLWQWNATNGWQQLDPGGASLFPSSYWMSVDGYTDGNGLDQVIVGCNSPVKTSGADGAYNSLMWATVTTTGGSPTGQVFSPVTNYAPNITSATVGPEARTWWGSATAAALGKSGMIQPRPVIDKNTVNSSGVTIYCAGSAGFWISTGNTIGSSGPETSTTPLWALSCDGMPLHTGQNVTVHPNNPLDFGWTAAAWCSFLVTDGTAYNTATTTQGAPPVNGPALSGEQSGAGYAMAYDPDSGLAANPDGTVYLSTGDQGRNDNGQIWAQAATSGAGNSYQNISISGPPFTNATANPGTSGGQVAYGLAGGRDGSGNPYLLAFLQGGAGVGGVWRFSGYTITAGQVNTAGGAWALATSTPVAGGASLGTSGGAANIPTGPVAPLVTDPNQPGTHFVFDQNTGVWRSVNYGASWTQIWAITNSDQRSGQLAVNPSVTTATELWVSAQGGASAGLFKIPAANTVTPGTGTSPPAGTVTVSGIATPGGLCFAPVGDVYCLSLDAASGPSLLTQLMVSQNGGTTWSRADNGTVAASASSPSGMACASSGRIYIAAAGNIVSYGYPSIQVAVPQAGLSATASMFAQPQTSGTQFAAASMTATASMTASPGGEVIPFLPMSATASMAIGGAAQQFVLQQVPQASLFDYGCSTVAMTSSAGNTLMVLAGWDLSATTATAPMPAVYVTDSSGNLWYHVATTPGSVTGARCAAWVCPNASPVTWVSVSLTTFASSLAFTVLELNGQPTLSDGSPAPPGSYMPPYFDLDILDATGQQSAGTLALSPGSTSDVDFAFSVFCTGSLPNGTATPAGWSPLVPVVATPTTEFSHGVYFGITSPQVQELPALPGPVNPVVIYPYYQAPAIGTSLATTYTLPAAAPVAGITFAVKTTVYPPYQPSPSIPAVKVEAGFGAIPGDPSQPPPAWTDITSRVIAPLGQSFITSVAGRQYELAQAEAGTLEVWLDNHDGAFTPGNTASVFYPSVVLGVPLRVTAWWAGTWHSVAFGFCERWPQEWPDLPQWGISKAIFTDAISVLAAVTMDAALDSDVLLDGPWVLLPAGEQYLSFSNGLNGSGGITSVGGTLGSFAAADAAGFLAQNYSRLNQRNGVYADGNAAATGGSGNAIAATGQTTNLLGSANTGFGTSAITTAPTSPSCGPGILYTDPSMPDPLSPGGVTVSFWVIIPSQTVAASVQPTVFTAYGTPSSYSARPSLTVQVLNFSGSSLLQVTLADGTNVTAPFSGSGNPQTVMLVINSSSLSVFVNGALAATKGLSTAQATEWNAVSWGCPNYAYGTAGLTSGNFTMFDLAVFGATLPAQRAVSQYTTGLFGQQNVDAVTRVAQILAWAGIGLPRAGQIFFNGALSGVLQGPAYDLAGTTASDAVNQIAVNENGLIAAMPGGSLVFFHQWALFNQSPSAVLGDSPDPTQGQVPYLPGQSWGYDNTYLYNLAQITQQYGPNNLVTVTSQDFTSDAEYFPRTALTQTITTMSALDAYALVQWIIGKYSQPSLRVSTVTMDASSNPAVAFPVILSLLQGQVVTITRSPVGGATITQNCILEKIGHSIGPASWQAAYQASPYEPEDAILQLDNPSSNTLGSNVLA